MNRFLLVFTQPLANLRFNWKQNLKNQFQRPAFWSLVLFLAVNIFVRFYNYPSFLYFIWDQGRDAWAMHRIIHGDLALVGPTSGLAGFFLGPLWFYLGIPGYLLSGGSPYGISLWYIFISLFTLPLVWWMTHQLFSKKWQAQLAAWFMVFNPGSILASVFIWNPLVAVPLMAGVFCSLLKARKSRWWLGLAFLLLGLTLQAEFAYAVFLVGPLWLLIAWIRQRFDWRDYLAATIGLGITFLPQAVFELLHKFVMTKSLLFSLQDQGRAITWQQLLANRPHQLWQATDFRLFGNHDWPWLMSLAAIFALIGFISWIYQRSIKKQKVATDFAWQLLALLAVIPYAFYLVWRGNYGNFFDYYLTTHFLFIIPWIMRGIYTMWQNWKFYFLPALVGWGFLAVWLSLSFRFVNSYLWHPDNQAGLQQVEQSLQTILDWQQADQYSDDVLRIFTPNLSTEQYDFVLHFLAKKNQIAVPRTVRQDDDQRWYLLLENPNPDHPVFRQWYQQATDDQEAVLVRQKKSGAHILEVWEKASFAK